jgi:AraC-like DNA-binding protein
MEHLRFFKSIYPYIPLIVMTDNGSEDLAVKIFRNGASDYLKMPLDVQELKKRIRNALGKGNIRRRRKSDYVYDAFRSTVQYVNENYNEQITLPRIAKEAGMSISCFERTFKKYMGSTFTIYVNRLRIARAAEMLRNERLSTSEIAFECGFTNQYHFTRVFKKINEVSPRSYRKSLNI